MSLSVFFPLFLENELCAEENNVPILYHGTKFQ